MAKGHKLQDGTTDGTQVLRRAAAVLRCLGRGGTRGVGLLEITQALQLPRSTTHRILKCLVEEGLVRHDTEQRRYFAGQLTYELGLTATGTAIEIAKWRLAIDRVSQRTGVTAYLMARSGVEATCVLKTEGNSVIRVIPVEIGQRRFLGVGAGATALLAALDQETREGVIRAIGPHLPLYSSLTENKVRDLVNETLRLGYTISRGNVVHDVVGIGLAIPNGDAMPHLALSVAGLASQNDEKTTADWVQIMRQEMRAILTATK